MSDIIGIVSMTPTQFFAIPNGTRIFNHDYDQCVALANEYHEGVIGGAFVPVESARQWWNQFTDYPQLTSKYTQVAVSGAPKRGDIFVAYKGGYDAIDGHIGVVERDWDGVTFGTIEQNAGSGAARWAYRYNRSKQGVLGFLRPQGVTPTVIGDEEVKLIWSDPAQGGDGSIALVGEFTFTPVGNMDQVTAFAKAFGPYSALSREEYLFNQEQIDVRKSQFGGSFNVNIDAIAQAVADKIDCGGTPTPCETTKADILESIEANYPEDK